MHLKLHAVPTRRSSDLGGSWVTEFEVITGVDSRIFGYHGFYTHFYIAPKVKNSFVEYLVRKGYKTAAFYPVEGSFYNAEDRKSTRLNSSHLGISYAVFC